MIAVSLTVDSSGTALPQSGSATNIINATAPGQRLTGKSGVNNAIYSLGGGSTLIGGGADDTFYVESPQDQVIVPAGTGGIDTVVSWGPEYVLPANVRNLIVQSGSGGVGVGNNLNNLLVAEGASNYTLVAGTGQDVMIGNASGDPSDTGGGSTKFVVAAGDGNDVIANFRASTDTLQLNGFPALNSFAAVTAAMTQIGSNVVLNLGNSQTITFDNQTIAAFTPTNFHLAANLPNMRMVFDDEFNSFVSSPNGSQGWMTQGGNLWRNLNEQDTYYSDSSVGYNPFSDSNGVLNITAAPGSNPLGMTYNSGIITTEKSFTMEYGYFEVSAQLPAGQGLWPAIWLLPSNFTWPPEIDSMEMLGNDPSTIYTSTHSGPTNISNTIANYVGDTSKGFHTYGVDWEPNTITYYFDGTEIAQIATPSDMNQPMYLLINLGVGTANSWSGPPSSSAEFPATMKLDYVHIYASANSTNIGGSLATTPGAPVTIDGTSTVSGATPTPPPVPLPPTSGTGAISGQVWNDANQNGWIDSGETGVAGATVELLNASGTVVATTTTATTGGGFYSFSGLAAGTYQVKFLTPTGEAFDAQANASTGNATTGITAPIALAAGATSATVDQGFYSTPAAATGAISGQVWNDPNQNGWIDSGETGIAGATVELLSASGTVLATTTTATTGGGYYSFNGLAAGTYQVKFLAPTGDRFDAQTNASTGNATTGITAPIALAAGATSATVDQGLYATPAAVTGAIGGQVWNDTNANGWIDSGETGAAGATVELLNASGTVLATTTTATTGGGYYSFTGLAAGTYQVKFLAPTGESFDTQTNASLGNATTGITAPVTLTSGQTSLAINEGIHPSTTTPPPVTPPPTTTGSVTVSGWGQQVTEGSGTYTVSGTAGGTNVVIGNGNETLNVSGIANTAVLGNGNETITYTGNNNTVTTGSGTSKITLNGSYEKVTVGATPTGTTTITAAGYGESITSTGPGNVTVTGPTGSSVVTLGNGNQTVTLGGSSNIITVGTGTSTIVGGNGNDIIHAAGGSDTITVTGYNNLLDAGSGMNFLHGGSGNDTFVLNGPGQGTDTITGFQLVNHDVIDLHRALAGAAGSVDMANVGNYVTAVYSGGNTTLSVDLTGGHGTPTAIATLVGVNASMAALVANQDLKLT
jgi:beta-glucanase (GH16 family)